MLFELEPNFLSHESHTMALYYREEGLNARDHPEEYNVLHMRDVLNSGSRTQVLQQDCFERKITPLHAVIHSYTPNLFLGCRLQLEVFSYPTFVHIWHKASREAADYTRMISWEDSQPKRIIKRIMEDVLEYLGRCFIVDLPRKTVIGVKAVINNTFRGAKRRGDVVFLYKTELVEMDLPQFKKMISTAGLPVFSSKDLLDLCWAWTANYYKGSIKDRILKDRLFRPYEPADSIDSQSDPQQDQADEGEIVDEIAKRVQKCVNETTARMKSNKKMDLAELFLRDKRTSTYISRGFFPTHEFMPGLVNEFDGFDIPPWWFPPYATAPSEEHERSNPRPVYLTQRVRERWECMVKACQGNPLECELPVMKEFMIPHLVHCLANGQTALAIYMLKFMCSLIQDPMNKKNVAIILQGPPGMGKSFIYRLLLRIIGGEFCHTTSTLNNVTGTFNGVLAKIILMCFEETKASDDTRKTAEQVKDMISNVTQNIRRLYKEVITLQNFINIILISNNSDAWWVQKGARRFVVLAGVIYWARHHWDRFFTALIDNPVSESPWLLQLACFLYTYDISDFKPENIIKTPNLIRMMNSSLRGHELWILDSLKVGRWMDLTRVGTVGFRLIKINSILRLVVTKLNDCLPIKLERNELSQLATIGAEWKQVVSAGDLYVAYRNWKLKDKAGSHNLGDVEGIRRGLQQSFVFPMTTQERQELFTSIQTEAGPVWILPDIITAREAYACTNGWRKCGDDIFSGGALSFSDLRAWLYRNKTHYERTEDAKDPFHKSWGWMVRIFNKKLRMVIRNIITPPVETNARGDPVRTYGAPSYNPEELKLQLFQMYQPYVSDFTDEEVKRYRSSGQLSDGPSRKRRRVEVVVRNKGKERVNGLGRVIWKPTAKHTEVIDLT